MGSCDGACLLPIDISTVKEMHLQEELLRVIYGENLYVTAAGVLF